MNLPSYLKSYLKKTLAQIPYKQSGMLIVSFFMAGLCNNLQAQANSQNLNVLRQQTEAFLLNHFQSVDNEKLEIKLGAFDRRLNLTACEQPLIFSLQDTAAVGGNLTVNCQCKGSPGWIVHLPAQVEIFRPVLVATNQITRGELFDATDLVFETRDISQISGELLRSEDVIGKAAKRLINKGDVIKPTLLDQPKTISRGDNVSITAKSGIIQVVMQGTAMTDGKLGQQIRVRNNQSDRIISAKVVGQAAVEIL